jgi:hypothetical protein
VSRSLNKHERSPCMRLHLQSPTVPNHLLFPSKYISTLGVHDLLTHCLISRHPNQNSPSARTLAFHIHLKHPTQPTPSAQFLPFHYFTILETPPKAFLNPYRHPYGIYPPHPHLSFANNPKSEPEPGPRPRTEIRTNKTKNCQKSWHGETEAYFIISH